MTVCEHLRPVLHEIEQLGLEVLSPWLSERNTAERIVFYAPHTNAKEIAKVGDPIHVQVTTGTTNYRGPVICCATCGWQEIGLSPSRRW